MKQLFVLMALAASAASANTVIDREALGSGTPGEYGYETALPVLANDIFHAPQFLPYHPTAATIWPRIVEVPCTRSAVGLTCAGYHTLPEMGRGEYLFFKPRIVQAAKPEVVIVPGPTVYVEVPVKKKKE